MKVEATPLTDLLVLNPDVHGDHRGFFLESWARKTFQEHTNLDLNFVQDNHSRSKKGVLRGLHYQLHQPQGKLVRVSSGSILDVAVDLRKSSPTFGQSFSVVLSDQNHKQLWIPPGFAHGFHVLSETADFLYKATDYYAPDDSYVINWNDADLAIDWMLQGQKPQLSKADQIGVPFNQAPYYS